MNKTLGIISANYMLPEFDQLSEKRPAANFPFGGRYRLMDFAFSNMVNARISTVGLVTPYYYRSIMDHVGSGKHWGLDRKQGGLFILPGSVYGFREELSSFQLRDLIRNIGMLERGTGERVLCCDCSRIYNADYRALLRFHRDSGCSVTLLYQRRSPRQSRKGWYLKLDGNGRVTDMTREEKGEALFLNCFVIDRLLLIRMLQSFQNLSYLDFTQALLMSLPQLRVAACEFTGYVGHVDSIDDYLRVSLDLLKPQVRHELFNPDRQICTKIHDEPPAIYLPGAKVRNSVVSSGSIIEGTVENSILFREVHVAKGAVLRNCIIMEQGDIGENARMAWSICDKQVRIGGGVTVTGTREHPCIFHKGKSI